MPFTFAHPAAIIPLLHKRFKGWFSATGLVIGSMAPDFESFVTFGKDKMHSHTWKGVFWYDMPMALAITFVFHWVVRASLVEHLPKNLRRRFEKWRDFDWTAYFRKHFIVVIYSLFIGILTHMLFDAFTHLNMSYPDSIRSRLMFGRWRVYILLQYAFSVIGLYVVWYQVRKLPLQPVRRFSRGVARYWIYIILVATAIGSYAITNVSDPDEVDYLFIINVCIASLLCALIFVSFVDRFIVNRLNSRSSH